MSRLVRTIRVKDPSGSEIALFEYEDVVPFRLFGLLPWRRKVQRFVLDTGEEVERSAANGAFRTSATGEPLEIVEQ